MRFRSFASLCLIPCGLALALPAAALAEEPAAKISFDKQIRPIFQASCQGCHQPAKAGGAYVMTTFDRLTKGGESGDAAIAPGKPDESEILKQITPGADGKAAMPKDKPALAKADIDLVRQWIEQGAKDDTPVNAVQKYDADHPPVYSRPPVITAIDYSPDGNLLAIAGFHEVIVQKADGSGVYGRLVGVSERIESVRFSPDGKKLAVSGGLPCRMGELQIWDVESKKLDASIPVTFDTIYGASWSPDGTRVAVGCADKTVRGFEVATGKQVFFSGAHDDWVVDTVFGIEGKHLVSVGRDMTAKLYETATERFIDNITSITPGALKGGLQAVVRHPKRNNILIGGSDGVPRVYRMERVTNRVIGDDANQIRKFAAIPGRIFGVDFSADGKMIAVASSLDGKGWVYTYASDFEDTLPDDIKAIVQKVASTQSAEEKKKLEDYLTKDVALLTKTELPASIYTVAFTPDGKLLAAAGADGILRKIDTTNGKVVSEAPVVDVTATVAAGGATAPSPSENAPVPSAPEPTPPSMTITRLHTQPESITLTGPYSYTQLLVFAELASGDQVDVTRMATYEPAGGANIRVSKTGLVKPQGNSSGNLKIAALGQSVEIPAVVEGFEATKPLSFIEDVNPVLSKVGCNAGTCHGSKDGKNGFKLSLRGYDAIFDIRSLTDDHASRRVNTASPDDSLMLLKATGAVPHVGGQLFKPGDEYYRIVRTWIAEGAKLNLNDAKPTRIDVYPNNPVVQTIGSRQQVRVVATYPDGHQRDVSRECFIESGNGDVAATTSAGLITVLRRGEAPVLARFEGAYAATTVTAMGERGGFAWVDPPTWGEVDRLVAEKWKRVKVLPSDLCTDHEFVRRVYLDLTGLPPSADEVRKFVADERDTRVKRNELVDKLIGSEEFIVFWTNKWADLLQVNGKFLAREGATAFRQWIRNEIASNTPYDQFAYKVLTASGSNKDNPAASYYKILRDPEMIMENTTHLFLAVRFNCNKCHDHPFERWTQDQYYETAAYFARVGLEADPASGDKKIGGTAVEGAKPLYEKVVDKKDGEEIHLRTGAVAKPEFPYHAEYRVAGEPSRREELARWITSADNQYFAKSYVNRIWGYLTGVGLIEPLDDIRAGNPPTNPELLDWLTKDFIAHGMDVRELMRTICKSRTYQLSVSTNAWNADDTQNYSHALARRLPAEVLFDALHTVTGHVSKIPGVTPGMRAAALPDSELGTKDGFLDNLGRPARESACECERANDLQLGPIMALMSGPTVGDAISDNENVIAKLVKEMPDNAKLFDELSLRILNKPASTAEIGAAESLLTQMDADHAELEKALAAYETKIAPVVAEQTAKREAGIVAAKKAHDEHQEAIKPAMEAAEKERQEKIAAAEKELSEYEKSLEPKVADWLTASKSESTGWTTLNVDLKRSKSEIGGKFAKMEDGSIYLAPSNPKKGQYIMVADIDMTGITGIKLEALTDSRLKGMGPGRAPNGNFVVTEFEVSISPKGNPNDKQKVELQNAKADYSQPGFEVATAIDGKRPELNNGWAVSPEVGKNHVATFECKAPIGHEGGSTITISIDQRYVDSAHSLGRFRLSVTRSPAPIGFGLPENLLQIATLDATARTPEQNKAAFDYFKSLDAEFKKKADAVAAAKKPLPEDPKLVELRNNLKEAEKPLPIDPQLTRLKRAVDLSKGQLGDKRLTIAQDYAWALINSPAFLFNR
jgi:WD40 repeat protein